MIKTSTITKFFIIVLALTVLPACIAKQTIAEDVLVNQELLAIQSDSTQDESNQDDFLEDLAAQQEMDEQNANELYAQVINNRSQRSSETSHQENVAQRSDHSDQMVADVTSLENQSTNDNEDVVEVAILDSEPEVSLEDQSTNDNEDLVEVEILDRDLEITILVDKNSEELLKLM